MTTEKFNKKPSRNAEEWGSPNEYGDSKRRKSGNKKDRRQNDKRKSKSTERSEDEWE